jgi:hypothetical protein
MRDPRTVLAQAGRMLAPGGLLVVAAPDAGGLQARLFGRHWLHLDVPRHLYHFDRPALAKMLEEAGFALVATHHQEFEYDLLGWAQSALNALTPLPNVFFAILAGRPRPVPPFWRWLNLLLGACFCALALPLVFVGTALRRGGTLVVMARRH